MAEELLSVCKVRRELWCVVDPMSAVCRALVMLQLEHLFDQTCESLCDRGEMLLKLPHTSQVCNRNASVGTCLSPCMMRFVMGNCGMPGIKNFINLLMRGF